MDDLIPQDFADNDLYKFTMGQVAFNQFPLAIARYNYINRATNKTYPKGFGGRLQDQINGMKNLRLSPQMFDYFRQRCPWLKITYLQWLVGFRFDPKQVIVKQDDDGYLTIFIEGPWFEAIYWEVPLLYIITQLSRTDPDGKMQPFAEDWLDAIEKKAFRLQSAGVNWIDFGTRRRASAEVQEHVVRIMSKFAPAFRGTSNPYFGMKYDVQAIGTYAHELPMAMQGLYGFIMSNEKAMEHWVAEYRGNLGIALPDTLTTPVFLRSFDTFYAKLFDGLRQDSGDPVEFGERLISHYEKLRINPMDKILTFSDSLNVDKAIALNEHFKGRIKTTFGIGTHLTNDVGWKASNHVIKMTAVDFGNGFRPLLKISDDAGKVLGGTQLVEDAKRALGI